MCVWVCVRAHISLEEDWFGCTDVVSCVELMGY